MQERVIWRTQMSEVLSSDLLNRMDAYWRAANYLTVGQIYLQDNPLLETPLKLEHINPRTRGTGAPPRGSTSFMYTSTD